MKHWRIGLLFWMVLLMGSCQMDSKPVKKVASLEGNWVLVEGFRGGKKTESLKDTYFTFTADTMSTNLPIRGATESPYSKRENVISQTVINDLTIDYTIQELTEHRLRLTTNLRGLDFIFILERQVEE